MAEFRVSRLEYWDPYPAPDLVTYRIPVRAEPPEAEGLCQS